MDTKQNAIICDIDGCLIKTDWLFEEAKRLGMDTEEAFTFFDIFANDEDNPVDYNLVTLLRLLNPDAKIIFLTARSDSIRAITRQNLERILPGIPFLLCMRSGTDRSPQSVVKENYLSTILEHYNILLAIDDNQENCTVFEKYNIPCILWKFGEHNEINRPH